MTSDLKFLTQIAFPNYQSNFANAKGEALFYNYSQSSSGVLTAAEVEVLVKGGVAVATADALATDYKGDTDFSYLFSESFGIGLDGSVEGSAKTETKVIASFKVGAKQSFSFDFSVYSELTAKEIENPNTEDNRANSRVGFLVLDTSNVNKPKVLDYFGIREKLVSSQQISNQRFKGKNVTISYAEQSSDINGNNGIDFLRTKVQGTYQMKKKIESDTNITVVEINDSAVEFMGDTLIDNLENGVIYGTISKDKLEGTNNDDKIYASLGKDRVKGNNGDDIIEGGFGDDVLIGNQGNDKINGGFDRDELRGNTGDDILVGGHGDDTLIGGKGSNVMTGDSGYDKFVFDKSDIGDDDDVITDFQIGVDKIELQGWKEINSTQWLEKMFSQGKISNTQDGVVLSYGEWTLRLAGLTSAQISPELFDFV